MNAIPIPPQGRRAAPATGTGQLHRHLRPRAPTRRSKSSSGRRRLPAPRPRGLCRLGDDVVRHRRLRALRDPPSGTTPAGRLQRRHRGLPRQASRTITTRSRVTMTVTAGQTYFDKSSSTATTAPAAPSRSRSPLPGGASPYGDADPGVERHRSSHRRRRPRLQPSLDDPAPQRRRGRRRPRRSCRPTVLDADRDARSQLRRRFRKTTAAKYTDQRHPGARNSTGAATPTIVPAEGGTVDRRHHGIEYLKMGSCGATEKAGERVFQWTPTISGQATIATCGTGNAVRRRRCTSGAARAAPAPQLQRPRSTTFRAAIPASPSDYHGSRVAPVVTAGSG